MTKWTKNIPAPNPGNGYYTIILDREVSQNDIRNMKLDLMPGFRFTWSYDKQIEQEAKYVNDGITKEFVR